MKGRFLGVLLFMVTVTVPAFAAEGDRILIEKAAHRMTLLRSGEVIRVFSVALGRDGLAPKERDDDGRVPVGTPVEIRP